VSDKLPDAVSELLASRVDSFEKLEVIVALHAARDRRMSVGELCTALKLPRDVVNQTTMELSRAALIAVASSGVVHLAPPTSSDAEAVAALMQVHAADRFLLVRALGELAVERIRNMASRTFAATRKPKKDDDV
jgi:hypothetical protein